MRIQRTSLLLVPVLDTSIYAAGDVLSVPMELKNIAVDNNGGAQLTSLVVGDKSNQKQAIDVLFFDSNPATSIGAANAAYGLEDADLPKLLGRVTVQSADFVSSGSNNAEATKTGLGLVLQAGRASKSIWVATVLRSGTPTFNLGDITLRLGVEQG